MVLDEAGDYASLTSCPLSCSLQTERTPVNSSGFKAACHAVAKEIRRAYRPGQEQHPRLRALVVSACVAVARYKSYTDVTVIMTYSYGAVSLHVLRAFVSNAALQLVADAGAWPDR